MKECSKCGEILKPSKNEKNGHYCPNGCSILTAQAPLYYNLNQLHQLQIGDGCYITGGNDALQEWT